MLTVALLFMGVTSFAQALVGGTVYPINGQATNAPVSFRTLKDAIAHLSTLGNGVTGSGQVILELTADYDPDFEFEVAGSITIPNISGTSDNLGITIRPATGVSHTITTNIASAGTIQFNGGQYITIDGRRGGTGDMTNIGLTIINTSTSSSATATATIKFTNGSSNNIVTYNNLRGAGTHTTFSGVVFFGSGAGGNNTNSISYNDITSTANRVTNLIGNYNGSASSVNNVIIGNNLHDFSSSAIYLHATGTGNGWEIIGNDIHEGVGGSDIAGIRTSGTAEIENNEIHAITGTGILAGIQVLATVGATNILGNRIHTVSSTGSIYAVRIASTTDASRTINIVNNAISLIDAYVGTAATNDLIGVSVLGVGTVNLYFNTIHVSNTVTPNLSYACFGFTSGMVINVRNSILSAAVIGKNSLITGDPGVTINRSHSLFVNRAIGGNLYNTDGNETFYYGMNFRPGAPNELFTSLTGLTIQPEFISLIGTTGTPIVGYTTDINGVTRDVTTPSKGAHDYSVQVLPVTISSFNARLNNSKIQFNWAVGTETNVNRYEVERLQADGGYVKVAQVTASGAASYTATDAQPLLGDNYYRLKSVDNDGSVGYYAELRNVKVTALSDKTIKVYPNPIVGNEINVALTNYPAGQYSYKIVGVAGNTVKQGQFSNIGTNTISLSGALPKGVYVLHIANGANVVQSKLVKN